MIHDLRAEYMGRYLRPLRRDDIEDLRIWRNESSLNRYLRATGQISPRMQEAWYEGMLADPDQVFFAIGHGEHPMVGALSLYNFAENSCQIGRIIIGEASERGKGLGRLSFLMAMAAGIRYFDRERFRLFVHPDNKSARAMYQRIGFSDTGITRPFGDGGVEYEMEIDRQNLYVRNEEMKQIVVTNDPTEQNREQDHA